MFIYFLVAALTVGGEPEMLGLGPAVGSYRQFYTRAECERRGEQMLLLFQLENPDAVIGEHGCAKLREKWI